MRATGVFGVVGPLLAPKGTRSTAEQMSTLIFRIEASQSVRWVFFHDLLTLPLAYPFLNKQTDYLLTFRAGRLPRPDSRAA